jgi:hypothetical protein
MGGGVGNAAIDDHADGWDGEREHRRLPHAAIAPGR